MMPRWLKALVAKGHKPAEFAAQKSAALRSGRAVKRGRAKEGEAAIFYRLSFAVNDMPPAPQHGQFMATRMLCLCSSLMSALSSICRVCC